MGDYTGLRFKGIIKPEYRKDFEGIALSGDWGKSKHDLFNFFGTDNSAGMIPCGVLAAYLPDDWLESTEFARQWNEKTGYWVFDCSMKNYWFTIDHFLEIVPEFVEFIEHLEVRYEYWDESKFYELVDGQLKEVNNDH